MVDTEGYQEIHKWALKTKDAVDGGDWTTATTLWGQTENVILRVTGNIDFYNILTKVQGGYIRQTKFRDAKSATQGKIYMRNLSMLDLIY